MLVCILSGVKFKWFVLEMFVDSGIVKMSGDDISNKGWYLYLVSNKIKRNTDTNILEATNDLMSYIP